MRWSKLVHDWNAGAIDAWSDEARRKALEARRSHKSHGPTSSGMRGAEVGLSNRVGRGGSLPTEFSPSYVNQLRSSLKTETSPFLKEGLQKRLDEQENFRSNQLKGSNVPGKYHQFYHGTGIRGNHMFKIEDPSIRRQFIKETGGTPHPIEKSIVLTTR